jgi:acyl-CoA thioester hydrolase
LQKYLKHTIEQDVKFSEVDSLGVVWHAHYLQYFEDGREAFGKQYNLGYLDFYSNGYIVPIVKAQLDYKRFLRYGDRIIIEVTYVPDLAAKINFEYRIIQAQTGETVATGSTLQVFLSSVDQSLQLNNPDFFQDWKVKVGVM